MRIAFVIQRYGEEVHGGSEYLCRVWAERLTSRHAISVLTTCARDYLSWADFYAPGSSMLNGVQVQRYAVDAPRDLAAFNAFSATIFGQPHSHAQELEWMRRQGPFSSALFAAIAAQQDDFDLFVFVTYLYCTTFFGLPPVQHKAVLVPTAHDEPPIHLGIFKELLRLPRYYIYLTPTERAMLRRFFDLAHIPGREVGIGIDPPAAPPAAPPADPAAPDAPPYLLYVGRVHTSKGCEQLYDYVVRYKQERPPAQAAFRLVFAGRADIAMPAHPDIVYPGFISEAEKHTLLRGCRALMIPSPFESLSIVLLEAWAHARPALVNGHCEVLREQVLRGNGGLFYHSYEEFAACLDLLLGDAALGARLGTQGRAFVAHWYNWQAVEARLETALHEARALIAAAPATQGETAA
jgi:glycosyltransferase involved in cell wall biosynthesis